MTGASWAAVTNPLQSSGRRPRGWAQINGKRCSVLKFQVNTKKHLAADEFSIHLEPWQQPEGFGVKYWADDAPGGVEVEIFAGLLNPQQDVSALPDDPVSLVMGIADDVAINPLTGTLVVSGRDKTAKLIDQKTSNRWPQHTSSQIVTQLAQQAGLQVQATSTSIPAGEYYRTDYGQLARSMPMWDLIAHLARHEGYDAYVRGNTLYFQPPQTGSSGTRPLSIVIGRAANGQIQCNAGPLEFRRKLTLAQKLSVDVKSHHAGRGQAVKANATRAAKGGGSGTQAYSVSRPNKSQAQAQQLADNMLGELAQHEFGFSATMDADLTFNANRQVQVSGTGTSLDTIYDVAALTWDWDSGENGGLKMAFSAKLAAQGSGTAPLNAKGSVDSDLEVPAPY